MPQLSKRKRTYTGRPKRHCSHGPVAMAEQIVNNVRRIGLNVSMGNIMPGDGNCFYHALVQQIQRFERLNSLIPLIPIPTHLQLRRMICQYVQDNLNEINYIQEYCELYENTLQQEYNLSWNDFITQQMTNGVYATELFIKTAAVLLGCNIYITSELCTETHPFNIITPSWDETDNSSSTTTFIIGNLSGIHFQSLIPFDEVNPSHSNVEILQPPITHQMVLRPRNNTINNFKESNVMQPETPKKISIQMNPYSYPPTVQYLGEMKNICNHCGSLTFMNEVFRCCHNGKVHLEDLYPYPEELIRLLVDRDSMSINFQQNIRSYNSAFAFASMGANLSTPHGRGPSCFRICGQIFHRSGTLHPSIGSTPVFNQLYIIDNSMALEHRMMQPANRHCKRDVMEIIQMVIEDHSPYAAAYRHMAEVERDELDKSISASMAPPAIKMYFKRGKDIRRYNTPNHDEVAAVFIGENGAPPMNRDIIVYPKDHPLQRISFMSANCDPMIYPLLFPRGDPGWHCELHHNQKHATLKRNRVTMLQFYAYRLAVRKTFSAIHRGKKLFQQYLVDAYVKIESQRLEYIRQNQQKLRVECYQGLIDQLQIQAEHLQHQPGRMVILPSSFQGSPRALLQNYQDAMAIISNYGKPDLFITFTCNPKWKEITENLYEGEQPSDRPDLLVRVFKLKLKELLNDICVHKIFGEVVANVHVIEFQKRGLSHCHMLLHLRSEDKLRDRDDIDRIISAEIPDADENPELHEVVKTCMIHGPCGKLNAESICMKDGQCTKNYPKEFVEITKAMIDGYPQYRRRNNNVTLSIRDITVDNRWVVPYNPWLAQKYQAHINVEACMSVRSVKYLYKYIYKGHDCIQLEFKEEINHDEISTFIDARYVSAPEAAWRIFEFDMHHQSHTVIRLAVHLPDQQNVYFHAGKESEAVEHANTYHTHLTAWFELNQGSSEAAHLLYTEIPIHYIFDTALRQWRKRQRGSDKVISRMYTVHPSEHERYFLRVLLLHVCGAKSFEDLQTIDGRTHTSFKDACNALGLLCDDNEWHNTLLEAANFQMPIQLRRLFAVILTHCNPADPFKLWSDHKTDLIEDFMRDVSQDVAEHNALCDIYYILQGSGFTLTDYGLPMPDILTSRDVNTVHYTEVANNMRSKLNEDQNTIANTIIQRVTNVTMTAEQCNAYYVDGPGGTGKTFTYNYLVVELCSRGYNVATAAWTGIATTLLIRGRTVHSLFKLPVPLLETSTCKISPTSKQAELLRNTCLIIVDEASMVPIHAFNAIDRMLRDITKKNIPFGVK